MVTIDVLGPVAAEVDGIPVELGSPRQRVALLALVLHRRQVVPTEQIVDELWPDATPPTAVKTVQVYVSQLRKVLGADMIETRGSGYVLQLEEGALDVGRFSALVSEARAARTQGEMRSARAGLEAALGLWRGAPYEEARFEDFAREEIARLEEERVVVVEDLTDIDLALGRHRELVPELEARVARDPLRERTRGQLMLALYRSGRQADALDAYRSGARHLQRELGLEPAPELRELEQAILRQDPSLNPPAVEPTRFGVTRRRARAVVAGVAVAVALAAGVVLLARPDGESTLTSKDNVALLDAHSGRVRDSLALGGGPATVAADGDTAWTLEEDSGTITRVDLTTGRRLTRTAGGTPTAMTVGLDAVWVVTQTLGTRAQRSRAELVDLDPDSLRPRRAIELPGTGRDVALIAVAGGAVFVRGPDTTLLRVDPRTESVTRLPGTGARRGGSIGARVDVLAGSPSALWAATGPEILRVDPTTGRVTLRTRIDGVGVSGIAAAGNVLWVTDSTSGSLHRIDLRGRPGGDRSTVIGSSATAVTVNDHDVWAASPLDGSVVVVDGSTLLVERRIPLPSTPQSLAIAAGAVVVGLAASGEPTIASRSSSDALPAACGRVLSGVEQPDLLVAADLPLSGDVREITLPMVKAIQLVLRQNGYRAGDHTLGFQACDSEGAAPQGPEDERCAQNARLFDRTKRLIGVIGPFSSGCAEFTLGVLGESTDPPAVVSPTTSYVGLTRSGSGVPPDHPRRFAARGVRYFWRVYPLESAQGAGLAEVAFQLRSRRPLLVELPGDEGGRLYTAPIADGFETRGGELGLSVQRRLLGPEQLSTLPELIRRIRPDALVIAGDAETAGNAAGILRLRAALGSGVPILAPDGLFNPELTRVAGRAEPLYVSGGLVSDRDALPARGRGFMADLDRILVGTEVAVFAAYAGQATEVLLDAIARSDGTRDSVRKALAATRVARGIVGPIEFDAGGDLARVRLPVYRLEKGADAGVGEPIPLRLDRVITVDQ